MDIFGLAAEYVISGIENVLNYITGVLPATPDIKDYIDIPADVKGWLNWFVPFYLAVPVLFIWLGLLATTLVLRAVLTYFGVLK